MIQQVRIINPSDVQSSQANERSNLCNNYGHGANIYRLPEAMAENSNVEVANWVQGRQRGIPVVNKMFALDRSNLNYANNQYENAPQSPPAPPKLQ